MTPIELVLSRLQRVHEKKPGEWTACCPAHEDKSPSLSVSLGRDDCVLFHCFAGCRAEAVCEAIGIEFKDLFVDHGQLTDQGRKAWAEKQRQAERAATVLDQARPDPPGDINPLVRTASLSRKHAIELEEVKARHRDESRVLAAECGMDPGDMERLGSQTGNNSILAPIERGLARIEFPAPVPLSKLTQAAPIQWLWAGYLAAGHTTLLTALWKAGKTTMLAHLFKLMGNGGELSGTVTPGAVLIVSEESDSLWIRRRDELGIGDHVRVICRPFMVRPNSELWAAFVEYLAGLVAADGYQVVVFDTLPAFWPVKDENDASAVLTALTPLHAITKQGAAVLLVHHPRKGDATEAQASRGSGSLPAFVDTILELRRYRAEDAMDRRRTLRAYGRFDETPPEAVIELRAEGYASVGNKAEAGRGDRLRVVGSILDEAETSLTVDQVRIEWPEGSLVQPGKRTLLDDLKHGANRGLWGQSGDGRKGNPFKFASNAILASSHSYTARIESGGSETESCAGEPDEGQAGDWHDPALIDRDTFGLIANRVGTVGR